MKNLTTRVPNYTQ